MAAVGQYLRVTTVFDEAANARVLALGVALGATRPTGVREIYPGYGNVYVEWDDAVLASKAAIRWIDEALAHPAATPGEPREVAIPVRYGGPDTDDVARATGLDAAQIVEVHSRAGYRCCALGAAPGQPMLGGTDERLQLPRRPVPRGHVPALSVAVAGRQATVYPVDMPGGWNLIGTALAHVYDPHRAEPFLVRHGDRVRFHAADGEPPAAPAPLELLPADPALPALIVEEAGALDLLVDGGRIGQSQLGMAEAGPLDTAAARLANALCDEPAGTTLLESTLTGPLLVALRPLVVGAAGAGLALEVDGVACHLATVAVRRGQRLRLRPTGAGVRGYLAVAGGIASETFLGSTSVDLRGLVGRPLRAGDVLGLAAERTPTRRLRAAMAEATAPTVLRLLRGPQWTAEAEQALTSAPFAVATGDRTGVRLDGPEVPGGELLSESPPPGAVQVPGGGAPILLLADRLRSAGYPKPAVIHPADLSRAAQLRAGDRVRFVVVGEHPVPWIRDVV